MQEQTESEKLIERMKKVLCDSATNNLSNDVRASAHIGLGILLAGMEIASAMRENAAAAAAELFYTPDKPTKKGDGK